MKAFASLRTRLAIAVLIVIGGLFSAPILFPRLDTSLDPAADSEAEIYEVALSEIAESDGEVAALLTTPSNLVELETQIKQLKGVSEVSTQGSPKSDNVHLITATITPGTSDDDQETLLEEFQTVATGSADEVKIGGSLALDEELGDTAESDLLKADAIAIPIVLILFGLILGGVRVALIPLGIVVVVLTGSLALLMAISQVTTVSIFAVNVVTLFGVGLAVDYGLLIVSRFREETAKSKTSKDAARVSQETAGRAVLYSGLTVAGSLVALLAFKEPALRSMAYGGIAATLLAVGTAYWLLPPALSKWGHQIRPVIERSGNGVLYKLTRRIQRVPALVAVTTVVLLLVMAAPLTRVNFEGLDSRSLPADSPTRDFLAATTDAFPEFDATPIVVLVDASTDDSTITELATAIRQNPETVAVQPVPAGSQTILQVSAKGPPTSKAAQNLVRDIRALQADVDFGVTGEAAEEVDLLNNIKGRLLHAVALLVVIMIGLLITLTGAPVIAIKAMIINSLSVAASFGVLVLAFQNGLLSGLLDFEAIGGLSAVTLVLTFAFAFGLSMDYEVFILARIQEHYKQTKDNNLAVALGLQQSGRVVTLAATLIIIVFVGFSFGEFLVVKQLGVGLALAVAIDATVVRLALVPATMTLLGRQNWWRPGTSRPSQNGSSSKVK